MTTRPWLRSAALVLALPMLITVVAYDLAWWFSDVTGAGDGYVVKIVSQAQPALSLGYVFVAASGAASGLAFRRTGLSDAPSSRSSAEIVLRHLAPTLCLGVLCWLLTIIVSMVFVQNPHLTAQPLPIIAVQLLGVLAWAVAGFALGMSRLGAASLALVPFLCFFVFGFVESLPARFGSAINGGDLQTCCTVSTTIAPGSLIANALFYTALLLGALTLLARPRRLGGRFGPLAAAAGVLTLTFAVVVGSLTPYPALSPRPGTPACSTIGPTTVCLWPEQTDALPTAPELIAEEVSLLREAGVDVPSTVTASPTTTTSLAYPRTPTSDQSAQALVIQSLTSIGTACGEFGEKATPALLANYDVLSAWLYRAGGLDEEPIVEFLEGDQRQLWDRLDQVPSDVQAEWVNASIGAVQECAEAPPELPADIR